MSRKAELDPETTELAWGLPNDYTSPNQNVSDAAWAALSADDGLVALDMAWAEQKGLPASTALFPWDRTKRLYVLNAYHGIHCVVRSIKFHCSRRLCIEPRLVQKPYYCTHRHTPPLYVPFTSLKPHPQSLPNHPSKQAQLHRTFREYRDNLSQSHAPEHTNHCLDWLRNDIQCHADDTPLYESNSRRPDIGIGQVRRCRDWSRLQAWAREHHSCYRYGDFVVEDQKQNQVGRFRFCPAGSPYGAKVERYLGEHPEVLL